MASVTYGKDIMASVIIVIITFSFKLFKNRIIY